MDRQWYYIHSGNPAGPFSRAALCDMVEAGVVSPDTLVWSYGQNDWTPLRNVDAFRSQGTPAPPPAPSDERSRAPTARRERSDESAAKAMYIASCTTFAILLSLALYGAFQGGRAAEGTFAGHSVEGGATIHLGDTVTDELKPTDALLDDSTHYDNWLYEGTAGERIDVRLASEAFDPYLFIRTVDPALPKVLGEDDDGGSGTNARLQVKLPQDGTYTIVVNSYLPDGKGAYTLMLSGTKSRQVPP